MEIALAPLGFALKLATNTKKTSRRSSKTREVWIFGCEGVSSPLGILQALIRIEVDDE